MLQWTPKSSAEHGNVASAAELPIPEHRHAQWLSISNANGDAATKLHEFWEHEQWGRSICRSTTTAILTHSAAAHGLSELIRSPSTTISTADRDQLLSASSVDSHTYWCSRHATAKYAAAKRVSIFFQPASGTVNTSTKYHDALDSPENWTTTTGEVWSFWRYQEAHASSDWPQSEPVAS